MKITHRIIEEGGVKFLRSASEGGNAIDKIITDGITSDQMGFLKRLAEHELSEKK